MKTIEINKNGFGIAELFSNKSTKEELIGLNNMQGLFLEELNIEYEIGDIIKLKSPTKDGCAYFIYNIKVYNITDDIYECEFI